MTIADLFSWWFLFITIIIVTPFGIWLSVLLIKEIIKTIKKKDED